MMDASAIYRPFGNPGGVLSAVTESFRDHVAICTLWLKENT
jgi:hypothetical protein